MSFKLLEQPQSQVIYPFVCIGLVGYCGEIWIPVKLVVKSLEYQNRKTSRSFKFYCRYADLDCRREMMKSNCRPGLSMGDDEKQLQESSNGDPAAAYSSLSG
ncbi:hypothetical protein C1H46_025966 [Malus baccata]|uniref:Uncharacterized protein n=1 Tax=Malus baccata TaxID=106549 RepID=A0A540LQA8_MALBA|nr:hypothetical protein C1H46_025966 [Malus baccata]